MPANLKRRTARYLSGKTYPRYPVPALPCKAVIMPTGKNDKQGIAYVAIATPTSCYTWWADGELITEGYDRRGFYYIFHERWKQKGE